MSIAPSLMLSLADVPKSIIRASLNLNFWLSTVAKVRSTEESVYLSALPDERGALPKEKEHPLRTLEGN